MRAFTRSMLAAGAVCMGAASVASAADTPQQTYDHYVSCTSAMLAAQSAVTPAEGAKADEMLARMRSQALAAGAAVSIPPERTASRIAEGRDRLTAELRQPDAAKAKAAKGDVGRTVLSCSFDELGKAIAAAKAQRAAAAGK